MFAAHAPTYGGLSFEVQVKPETLKLIQAIHPVVHFDEDILNWRALSHQERRDRWNQETWDYLLTLGCVDVIDGQFVLVKNIPCTHCTISCLENNTLRVTSAHFPMLDNLARFLNYVLRRTQDDTVIVYTWGEIRMRQVGPSVKAGVCAITRHDYTEMTLDELVETIRECRERLKTRDPAMQEIANILGQLIFPAAQKE